MNSPTDKPTVNWKQALTFLGLTFGLTYLMNLVLFRYGGFGQVAAARGQLQIQLLVPATVAMVELTPRRLCQMAVWPAAALMTLLAKSRGLA